MVPPPKNQQIDRFFLLSEHLEGDVLQPIWTRNPEHIRAAFGADAFPVYTSGRFRYHWLLQPAKGWRGTISSFLFCIREGLRIHREARIDCIVTYSHMTTALFGVVLKLMTGARLIVEIVTAPQLVYKTERPKLTFRDRLMRLYSDLCLHVSLLAGGRAHLLFPSQLEGYPLLRKVQRWVFPEFLPASMIRPSDEAPQPYVLMVGAPWYLKGADRLIESFLALAEDFPGIQLKIIGHYPDAGELRALARGSERIEIIKAMPYPEIVEAIRKCLVLAVPSRCEGTPRVIMEAMAAGVPVIASDVGGIPDLIRQGETGFIVAGGNTQELEMRMRQLLSDPELRARLGQKAGARARSAWNEKAYVKHFTRMIEAAASRSQP
jgi:glycosyltransferase involved in cell wall biosynthesis